MGSPTSQSDISLYEELGSVAARIRDEGNSFPAPVAGAMIGVLKAAKGIAVTATGEAVANAEFSRRESLGSLLEDIAALKVQAEREAGRRGDPGFLSLLRAIETVENALRTEKSLERPPPRDRA